MKNSGSINNDFKIRLSRTSSALGIMKERRKSIIQLQDIIDENKSYDTVTGKLPVEAALVMMKRVNQEAGLYCYTVNAAGHSAFDKLQSYKPEPVLDVLKEKTWREFFTSQTNDHLTLANNNTTFNNQNMLSDTEVVHRKQLELKKNLEQIFQRLIERIEYYWMKLKIPIADQTFYRKSLCKEPAVSFDQCKEISSYVYMLKLHEEATIQVIQAIQLREITIAKAFDVLAALQRKVSRGMYNHSNKLLATTVTEEQQLHGGGGCSFQDRGDRFGISSSSGGGGMMNKNQLNNSNNKSIIGISKNDFKSSNFWKEELLNSFEDVRSTTLEVIKKIQNWRRNLWRPHPFIYMGQNYLSKMKYDLMVLESDMYIRILALLPLKYEDLQCIVFINGSNNSAKSLTSNSRLLSPNHVKSSPSNINIQYNKSYNNNSNNNDDQQAMHDNVEPQQPQSNIVSSSMEHYVKYIEQMIVDFTNHIDFQELDAAATVVLEEDVLQNALSIEQISLSQKGVFIPTLRLKPINTTTNNNNNNNTAISFEESFVSKVI